MWTPVLILLWTWVHELTCATQPPTEEVEIFHLTKQSMQGWTSDPKKEFIVIELRLGDLGSVPVIQACARPTRRTFLSKWMERGGAHHLLLDITFAQEAELSGQSGPLQVYLIDSDTQTTRLSDRWKMLDLRASRQFPQTADPTEISQSLTSSRALSLGPVTRRGFQLGFFYTGTCLMVTSFRLYYRRCPDIVVGLSSFTGTGAGSGPVDGSCVQGALKVSPPVRECSVDGVWGPQRGECVCEAGHQPVSDTCQACGIGFYRAANQSRGCLRCAPNSGTHREGSENCDCLQGFSRLPTDPHDLGCTKPPTAPVNVTAHHHNDSGLLLTWDPPHDWGGRQELTYHVRCETQAQAGVQWEKCEDDVVFLPDSNLTSTSVSLSGLNPHHDYRLSVQARNDISTQQGAPPSSTATVTIQRWRAPPVVTVVSVVRDSKTLENVTQAPQRQKGFFMWTTVGVLFAVLLLMAVVPVAVCVLRCNYSKLRSEQEVELLPISPGVSYRRPQELDVFPQQEHIFQPGGDSVLQLLEGLGGRLANSLKEVLVERDQLTLGKELGKGEFGSVFEAVFTPENGPDIKVAVKTLRVGFHNQDDLHDFLKEAEIMKNFDHENVVRLLGVTLQREQDCSLPVPLVILPFMKHGDLRRFLIATRYGDIPMFVPYQTLLRFMVDIAEGMDYLSSQGFLHRDLAARNCMLGDDLRVCVADFGLSKQIHSSNYYRQREAIRVPIKWLAMESLSESVYTTKSDVWSFGITMWEIVSRGKTPYPGVHNHELLDLLLTGHRLKPTEDCDSKLWEVMFSCWESEPTQRPGFRELADRLKALLSELPVLEACQEATYINHGLEVAAAAAYQRPQSDSGETRENVYLPAPVGAAAAPREDNVELEDGYLKYISGSAV